MEAACIFCDIATGRAVADIVHQSEAGVWFRDISPKAPVHIVGIPRRHVGSLADVSAADSTLLGELMTESAEVARAAGLTEGYRLITNVGPDAGQQVSHLHFHILGGESLGPLRC